MVVRIVLIIITFFLSTAFSCAGDPQSEGFVDPCENPCPDDHEPVQYCPAFTECVEVEGCEAVVICAPIEDDDNELSDAGLDLACDVSISCPDGTMEVSECPEGELCTRISHCDETLICLESELLCQQQPLCPDGDRPLDDCDDEDHCYRHHHCSGPVDCLRCSDELAQDCPTETVAVDQEICEDEVLCQRIETCEETLYCADPADCLEDAECPDGTEEVDQCDEDSEFPDCLTITGCDGFLHCQGEDPFCDGIPHCPVGSEEIDPEDCIGDPYCEIISMCGHIIGCELEA